jgi:hypothetical protein
MADELNVDLYDPVNAEALLWRGDKTGIFPVCLITISQIAITLSPDSIQNLCI